jgi:hypothetical protein
MVLTLSVNGNLVTHRLVGFGEYGELITRGDANSTVDEWEISSAEVVGLYRARLPYLGFAAALTGRYSNLFFSGAWFADAEFISGELGAHKSWGSGKPPKGEVNLRGSLSVSPFYQEDHHGIDVRICLTNNGTGRVDGLYILNLVQISRDAETFTDLFSHLLDINDHPSLDLGEEHCYETPIMIDPLEEGTYRDVVKVLVYPPEQEKQAALSQETGIFIALELAENFAPVDPPDPTSTPKDLPTPAPEETVDPAGGSEAGATGTPEEGAETATETGVPPALPSQTPEPTRTPTESPTLPPTPTLPPEVSGCTYSAEHWGWNPQAWPVEELELGGETYSQDEALEILLARAEDDEALALLQQLIAAKLNLENGAVWAEVEAAVEAAGEWLEAHPPGSKLKKAHREEAAELAEGLEEFNLGLSGPGLCEDEGKRPTPTEAPEEAAVPTPTPTETAEPTPTPAPTETPTPTETAKPTPTVAPSETPEPSPTGAGEADEEAQPGETPTLAPAGGEEADPGESPTEESP